MTPATTDGAVSMGRFRVREIDPAIARYHVPWWDALEPAEKLREAKHLPATAEHESENTTCVELHRLIVDLLDGSQPVDEVIDQLALGRSTTAPAAGDTARHDEVDRVGVTEFDDQGDSLQVRTFVGEGDANVDVAAGETISEAGLYAGGYFLNHSLFGSEIEKSNTVTTTVSATLTFQSG